MQQLRLADSSRRRRWWRHSNARISRGEGAPADVPPASFGVVSPVRADPESSPDSPMAGVRLASPKEAVQSLADVGPPAVERRAEDRCGLALEPQVGEEERCVGDRPAPIGLCVINAWQAVFA